MELRVLRGAFRTVEKSRPFVAFGKSKSIAAVVSYYYPKVQNKQALSLPKPADCENIRPLEVLHYGETMLQRP